MKPGTGSGGGATRIPAVILAAGAGTRLSRHHRTAPPKPLTPLLGLTLLERTILSLRAAGVEEFFVVLGHRADEIRPRLAEWAKRYGVKITAIENPEWGKGNGTSALAAAEHVGDRPFLLTMSDHLFEPAAVQRLLTAKKDGPFCYLLVDRRVKTVFDPEDATWVQSVDGKIVGIGKGLSRYNGVDTGLFLCHPILFPALREAQAAGDFSLSGGMRRLAVAGRLQAVEIGDLFWLDVDTPAALREARRRLLRGMSKPHEDGFISRFLNRPISTRISGFIVDLPWGMRLSPNMISLVSFFLVVAGAALFAVPGYIAGIIAGILVQLGSIIDGCDGEVARLTYRTSRFGAWFDTLLDRYADLGVTIGVSWRAWSTWPNPWVWIGGIAAFAGFILASYAKKEYALRYGEDVQSGIVERLIKRDLRLFAVFLGAVGNAPYLGLIAVGALSHLGVIRLLLTHRRSRSR
ncbi:hypothetical protein DRJ23_04350 [Candidatus Acetothermia bacterium]|nr:MAG: hypothetical protein DRJ23_04350 [Candidatus Acetothermia bacterium]